MFSAVFLLYATAHLALFAWALLLLLRHREPSTVPLLIVAFGLIYDNAILAAGGMIGHGEVLERLSIPRFFMHAFGTPLLMLAALGLVRRSGGIWTRSNVLAASVAILTLGMIAVGVDAELLRLELSPKQTGDLSSYGNSASDGPPIAPVVTIIVLLAAGAVMWRQGCGPWLLLGAIIQFVAAAVGDAVVILGNFGELALLVGLVATDSRLSPSPSSAAAVRGRTDS